ncbi:vegetative cell wall protein gp1-like [Iris pallida]|uniref:Vegetative cell wall protein gp1-like n=1 Tax=Iris pallida TaxID=29817 RepID=A0AAX6FGE1_IRIPA|nr:vegetative cell wall protein gp1-like [Iris pallida]
MNSWLGGDLLGLGVDSGTEGPARVSKGHTRIEERHGNQRLGAAAKVGSALMVVARSTKRWHSLRGGGRCSAGVVADLDEAAVVLGRVATGGREKSRERDCQKVLKFVY